MQKIRLKNRVGYKDLLVLILMRRLYNIRCCKYSFVYNNPTG